MTRKAYIVVFGIFLILALLLFSIFFFTYRRDATGEYKSQGKFANSVREFLPFGTIANQEQKDPTNLPKEEDPDITETSTSTEEVVIPRLRLISDKPTAGVVIFDREREAIIDRIKRKISEQFIRYIDRATGHMFETKKDNLAVTKISNNTIPKIYEAKFSSNPNIPIIRLLSDNQDTIISYRLELGLATTTPKINTATSTATSTPPETILDGSIRPVKSVYLELNMREVALAPKSQNMIYLTEDLSGGKVTLSSLDGTNKRTIFTSPIRGWLLDWPNESKAVISSKPSGIANGIVLLVDIASGKLSKIASGTGITSLASPDLQYAFISRGGDNISSSIINIKTNTEVPLSLKTIAEKCIWSKKDPAIIYCAVPTSIPSNTYPDAWYQGLVSFSDDLWKIDASSGLTTVISSFTREYGEFMDITNLYLSADDSYISFINKKDLSLWGFRLIEPPKNQTQDSNSATSSSVGN